MVISVNADQKMNQKNIINMILMTVGCVLPAAFVIILDAIVVIPIHWDLKLYQT